MADLLKDDSFIEIIESNPDLLEKLKEMLAKHIDQADIICQFIYFDLRQYSSKKWLYHH